MRPAREARRFGPDDMPPELVDFDEAAWIEPCPPACACDPDDGHGYQAASDRWSAARAAWCEAHGVSMLDVMIADHRRRFPDGVW